MCVCGEGIIRMSSKEMVGKKSKVEDVLKENTNKGKWEAVVQIYENDSANAQRVKVTEDDNTALHLAVIVNKEEIVETMMMYIKQLNEDEKKNVLMNSKNKRGNTPLHMAAMMGSVRMCIAIASADEELVGMRNNADETPLFLAAVHGNKDAFYFLYYYCREHHLPIATNCRVSKGGDTVLHRALNNEQFDLAFQLIHMDNESMNWVDEQGLTPLHILARKPTSFKSGSQIKGWRKIVYYGTFVNKLKHETIERIFERLVPSTSKPNTTPCFSFPLNYKTCTHFFANLMQLFSMVSKVQCKIKNEEKDLEKEEKIQICDKKSPINYATCMDILKYFLSATMIILGLGSGEIRKIQKKKEKHTWAIQVMEKLIEFGSQKNYYDHGGPPMSLKYHTNEEQQEETTPYNLKEDKVYFTNFSHDNQSHPPPTPKDVKTTTPVILIAAKNGVIDIVRALFHKSPLSIRETQSDKKNMVLLAAEFRQPEVYRFLLKERKRIENLFRAVDKNGNSALHLAAAALDPKLWLITGAAFQMQWEVKWYKYVKESVPLHLFARYNKKGETASEIFRKSHMTQVAEGGEWLYKTSESCSLVATLIATVAFATAVTVPGGNDDIGLAKLKTQQPFFIFSISSLLALCLSSTSMIMFLAILTSRFRPNDFGSLLPWKLLIGLSCLYFSIIAMLVSFCSGHYFLIINRLHDNTVLLYTLIFLPVALIFAIVQLPLYFDLLQAILKTVPKRSATVVCP